MHGLSEITWISQVVAMWLHIVGVRFVPGFGKVKCVRVCF